MEQSPELSSIQVALVGLKNLKTSHTWRIEFDVYETETVKLKELFDKIDESFHLFLVPIDKQQ
jgi:hypothetical protein